ncbi:MAG TPA: FlgD immunoglobulin-like domain containing protein [bacterium]|nr:FlgD immunoglobulin-like domain containing protein [bacterium]HQI48602.1 FlgD immunoglobulin-like domain containing protein [bacterium]HQJ63093.1 FlgD immunoglobulin-like domain containing protein [bacterium]
MSSPSLRILLCAVLLLGFAAASHAVVNLESGKVGVRISDAGSIRFVVPSTAGTRQIDRINIIAALNEKAVCDYNEDQDKLIAAYTVSPATIADFEGGAFYGNVASNLPPNVNFRLHVYVWKDQPYAIARYTVINDSSEMASLYLGVVGVPRINGSYGGETDKWDADHHIAYCFRGAEAGYAGLRLLSQTPYSYKALDWNVYSPADPNSDAATDSTRYHQTADPGFGPDVTAGADGSIFSLNAGPVILAPHDSVTVYYGIFYGASYGEMLAAADAAQAQYSIKLAANTATTNFETGKIGFRLSNAGSIRLIVPNMSGTRQIERVNIIAALNEKAVCDYNENHNPLAGTVHLTVPTKSDLEGFVHFDSRYIDESDPVAKPLPPNMSFDAHSYVWMDQPWMIVEYTVTNDSSEAGTFYLGAVVVPRINGNYGGESTKYDAASQTAYCYREGEAGYAGIRLLSHTPYSYKTLDWGVYSPEDPNADASTDSIRYHQTADPGFDADLLAGGDGSIYSLNAGAFTIPAHGSVKVVYGVVYGNSFADMVAASNAMQAKYQAVFTTAVELKPGEQRPERYALSQNWPNPFNPATAIRFELLERAEVRLAIYNLKGQVVRTVAAGIYPAGPHQVIWDGRDATGANAAAGVYLYRLTAGQQTWTKKMTLVR